MSAAEKDGVRLVAVTLDDPDDWNDHEALLDYGFSQLKSQKIDDSSCRLEENLVGGIEPFVTVSGMEGEKIVIGSSDHLTRTVELPQFLYAPVKTGQVVGRSGKCCTCRYAEELVPGVLGWAETPALWLTDQK